MYLDKKLGHRDYGSGHTDVHYVDPKSGATLTLPFFNDFPVLLEVLIATVQIGSAAQKDNILQEMSTNHGSWLQSFPCSGNRDVKLLTNRLAHAIYRQG